MRDQTWSRRTILGAVASVLAIGLAACGGSKPSPSVVGASDHPQAGSLKIDASGVVGTVDAGTIHLSIPVTNLASSATAMTLAVAITQVDGRQTFATSPVPVSLAGGGQATLTTDLAVPPGVSAQADWAGFNVVVEGPTGSGVRVTRSLLEAIGAYDVELEGPARVTRDRMVTYRVRAQNPTTGAPLPGTPVSLVVLHGTDKVASYDGTTTASGDAIFTVSLDVVGSGTVEAHGALAGTTTVISGGVDVETPGGKVLITTDKPIYQPGQVINLRALALDAATQKPISSTTVTFAIEDGKGNKIYKHDYQTDQYGLAATTFQLGQVLNLGTFQVSAVLGDGSGTNTAQKTVTVSNYALPKFQVDVASDKPWYTPGQTVGGTVDARYFFGQATAGATVTIQASTVDIGQTPFAQVMGKTDAQGVFPFSVILPSTLAGLPIQDGSALVNLHVVVVDTAGQEVDKDQPVTVAQGGMRLALVPENGVLVPDISNQLDLFVTDPLGNPSPGANVVVSDVNGTLFTGGADAYGQASFQWMPSDPAGDQIMVQATSKDGVVASDTFNLSGQMGSDHVLVRTDAAVYGIGDTVSVDLVTSADEQVVYVDWLNNDQDVDMRTVDVSAGAAHFTKTVDASFVGSNRIEAYIVGADGNIVRAGRTIFVRDAGGLSVALSTDQPQYAPGAPATLTLAVTDETGAPAVAALGVQIVDQAVFALVDAQPGLLRTYFELQDDLATPSYEIRPPAGDLTSLIFDDTTQKDPAASAAAQTRAAATFAAMAGDGVMGVQASSGTALIAAVQQKLAPYYQAEKMRLAPTLSAVANSAIATLGREGCSPTDYDCSTLQMSFLSALQAQIQSQFKGYDFWGNAYTFGPNGIVDLQTMGPDEIAGTSDDGEIVFQASDLNLPADITSGLIGGPEEGAAAGLPAAGAAGASGTAQTMATGTAGSAASGSTANPRVRQDFPETLYVNPELITGPDGKATVTLDMADSITDWRVSTLAHTAGGKLGGGVGDVKVFQDFFVDVSFPATLTRGDTVTFPIAVYNYLTTPQTVHLSLDAGSWYTPVGATTADVTVGAGQVTGVQFPVQVNTVGRQTLTVRAIGDKVSDAVARTVLVQPDGKAFPLAQSGSLAPGSSTFTASFPSNAVPGSESLYVDVFPAYLSQVVQGMDSLLRVPTGCFEQTTSTAWPNVLVTNYLQETNQLKPDIQLKAQSLMSAGYQRLLTFEHPGGGFSWFGTQDPAPFLSVTAFGLMEFSDMTKVQTVDAAMMQRTTNWLLSQQAADGSFAGDRSEFFTFQTSLVRNTAFVVWALAASGYQGSALTKGLGYVQGNLPPDADPYTLALAANAYLAAAPTDPVAAQLIAKLVATATITGDKASWDTAGTETTFYGNGQDGAVATTGLVAQALLQDGGHNDLVDEAVAFLTGSRDENGNFGSTQATIWTLRALVAAARLGTDAAVGAFTVSVDGAPFMDVPLTKDQSDVMTTVDMGSLASVGSHDVTLSFVGTGKVSYNLVSSYNVPWAQVPMPAPSTGPLGVTLAYDKTSLTTNDTAAATVTVQNNTASEEDMILVTLGIPPGFAIATADLDAYKAKQTLSAYEITGQQLILYVTSLGPNATQSYVYHLQATMPINASDGGAKVSLYYEPEKKAAAPATILQVVAAQP